MYNLHISTCIFTLHATEATDTDAKEKTPTPEVEDVRTETPEVQRPHSQTSTNADQSRDKEHHANNGTLASTSGASITSTEVERQVGKQLYCLISGSIGNLLLCCV